MGSTEGAGLPALSTKPKFIFFTDFDGTITQQDSNDFLVEELGCGPEKRREVFDDILHGRQHFRDGFREVLDTVSTPFDKCVELLIKSIQLDEGFKKFHSWARENNVPIIVLSGGMEPIIRALLGHLVGDEDAKTMQIFSSNVGPRPGKSINEEGGWEIVYRDDSTFGHDKSRAIRPYANLPEEERPVLFYAGDGVSDLSAARETDLLFAKEGKDLVTYCKKEGVPYTTFKDFSQILDTMNDIADGKITVKEAASRSS